ncbi:MAG: hypothetical protein CME21_06090 [Gemmatimonadetes bacterium]|jgi:hypothetical protein|nr:hypothetical protein [Gemmatimonadota bacterium]HCK10731.1 hypothetical protein [Candidatus Latescibacterota bacterium]
MSKEDHVPAVWQDANQGIIREVGFLNSEPWLLPESWQANRLTRPKGLDYKRKKFANSHGE